MKAHAQTISRKLRPHFRRSVTATTRVRGWHAVSEGYAVEQRRTCVIVDYRYGDDGFRRGVDRGAKLEAISQYLNGLGFDAQHESGLVWVRERSEVQA